MKRIIISFSFLISLCTYSIIFANEIINQAKPPLPELACLYETHTEKLSSHQHDHDQSTKPSKWRLWRLHDRVEIHNLASSQGEVWQKLKGDAIEFTWLYHNKKFAINYPPSDLKAVESHVAWISKAQIVSPKLLAQLKQTESLIVQGYPAEKYQGKVGKYDLEIIWLPGFSIPASIIQSDGAEKTIVKLLETHRYENAPWQPLDSNLYDDMDFADIGDNEANPIARSHIAGMGLNLPDHRH